MTMNTFINNYNCEERLMGLSIFANNPELRVFANKYHEILDRANEAIESEMKAQAQAEFEPEVA